MPETDFWCRLNLLENIMDARFFVYHYLLFRKLERISSLHVLCSCLNNMLFLERNVNIGMHAILDTIQFFM